MLTPTARRPTTTARCGAARALVEVCRGEVGRLPSSGWERELVTAARFHRVAPLAATRLRELRPDVAAALRPDRDAALAVHLRALLIVDELGRLLADVPWVTFKGPVLSELAHPVPGLRTYRDLDVLVEPGGLREACRRLETAGWVVSDYEDMLRNRDVPGEMHWLTPTGLGVDLHWSMINAAGRRRRFAVPTADILGRRRSARLGLTTVAPVLDQADAFVHVCLHAAQTGAHRLLLLLDVHELAGRLTDWDAVVDRARQWRAGAAVAVVLQRARTVLGTPVPAGLEARLGESAPVRALGATVNRSVTTLAQDQGAARLVARAGRGTSTSTLAAAGRSAVLWAWHAAAPPVRAPRSRRRADSAAVQAYLAAVEGLAAVAAVGSRR